ncbi:MAG: hypothetical protein ACTHPD_11960 [Rhizomicrobium sp.]
MNGVTKAILMLGGLAAAAVAGFVLYPLIRQTAPMATPAHKTAGARAKPEQFKGIVRSTDDDWTVFHGEDQMTDTSVIQATKDYQSADVPGDFPLRFICRPDKVELEINYRATKNSTCADSALAVQRNIIADEWNKENPDLATSPYSTPVETRVNGKEMKQALREQKFCNTVTLDYKNAEETETLNGETFVQVDRDSADVEKTLFSAQRYLVRIHLKHGQAVLLSIDPQSAGLRKFYSACKASQLPPK